MSVLYELSRQFQSLLEWRRSMRSLIAENSAITLEGELEKELAAIESEFKDAKEQIEVAWLHAGMTRKETP